MQSVPVEVLRSRSASHETDCEIAPHVSTTLTYVPARVVTAEPPGQRGPITLPDGPGPFDRGTGFRGHRRKLERPLVEDLDRVEGCETHVGDEPCHRFERSNRRNRLRLDVGPAGGAEGNQVSM